MGWGCLQTRTLYLAGGACGYRGLLWMRTGHVGASRIALRGCSGGAGVCGAARVLGGLQGDWSALYSGDYVGG